MQAGLFTAHKDRPTGRGEGVVITFYSYKGGAGRSMALANTACLLARTAGSKPVLIVDWDLEAPGLHRYFEKYSRGSPEGGHARGAHGVRACVFSPDGLRVISASEDQSLKIWDAASGREVTTFSGHTAPVTACAFRPDGHRVVSASEDHTLKLWDPTTGRELATLSGHTAPVTGCAVSPDGNHVVSASKDQTLRLWDPATGLTLITLSGHTAPVTACAFSPDSQSVVSASEDHTLKLWEHATGRELATLSGHTGPVIACAFSPDGRRVVSASQDNTLKLWNPATGRRLATLSGHTAPVTACAFSPDSQHVVSASEDHTLKLWDLATGNTLATLSGHTASVMACAVSPDGLTVISGAADGTLTLWDAAEGRTRLTLSGHPHLGLIEFFIGLDSTIKAPIDDEAAVAAIIRSGLERCIVPSGVEHLHLLKAGALDAAYRERVNTFKWRNLFEKCPRLFEILAQQWTQNYSYVLIDSRTGYTDVAGICTSLLPDRVVAVFTPNRQSLFGLVDVVKEACAYRQESTDPRPLMVFPLPARIENAEPALREHWRLGEPGEDFLGYQKMFEDLFVDVYGLTHCDLKGYFDEVQIQQVPRYAYGEAIAVLVESSSERLSLTRSYQAFLERLTASVAPWEQAATETEQLSDRALVLQARGDLDGALALHREQERIFRRTGNLVSLSASLGHQVLILRARGDVDSAMSLLKEQEQICRKLGDMHGVQTSLGQQALILKAHQDLATDTARQVADVETAVPNRASDASPDGTEILTPGSGATTGEADSEEVVYQRELARWYALPRLKRWFTAKPARVGT